MLRFWEIIEVLSIVVLTIYPCTNELSTHKFKFGFKVIVHNDKDSREFFLEKAELDGKIDTNLLEGQFLNLPQGFKINRINKAQI